MNIDSLILNGANVNIMVTPLDLKEFALNLVEQVKAIKFEEPEQYLSPGETAKKIGVTENTLWRWNKSKYLCPVKIGHKSLYKQSDINSLLGGRAYEKTL